MTRILLALLGVVLLAVVALSVLWLAGQLLVGLGAFATGTAGVLLKLLWFLVVAGLLGGAVFFVANAWRPGTRPDQPETAKLRPLREPQAVQAVKLSSPEINTRISTGEQLRDQP